MSLRAVTALGVVAGLLVGGTAMASPPPAVAVAPDVVVAMIDSGVRATHQEFDYGGPSDTTDQFVAWWDFSADASHHRPAPGQVWDTTTADPFDATGHGTATAGSAVGLNAVPATTKAPSFAPGFKLAVAKVVDGNDAISTADIVAAIKWARQTVQPDVISMSIGQKVPFPAVLDVGAVYDEIRLARQAGILVVNANGNGWGNTGAGPGEPGFAKAWGNSPDALGVGANGNDGVLVTTDPEVVSTYKQNVASHICDACYGSAAGTSVSTPRVAGFAAHLKRTALANGQAPTAGYLETLVKYSARNTNLPPTFEGYGVIDGAQLAGADAHAAAGTLPARPSPDLDALYVETVQGTLDELWTGV